MRRPLTIVKSPYRSRSVVSPFGNRPPVRSRRGDVPRPWDAREYGAVGHRPALRLERIDQHNWRAAVAVRVSAEQVRFVAGHQPIALVILAKAYVRPGGLDWEPLAVTSDASVVGIVALAQSAVHTELLHLAIDIERQGQGIGSAATKLVLAHVTVSRPGCREVQLTVHPDNARGQRLYRSVGFSPNGEMREKSPSGRSGWSERRCRSPVRPGQVSSAGLSLSEARSSLITRRRFSSPRFGDTALRALAPWRLGVTSSGYPGDSTCSVGKMLLLT